MKQFKLFFTFIIVGSILLSASCGNKDAENTNAKKGDFSNINETTALVDFVSKSGNIINSENLPFLTTADDVWENKSNYLVIDIRDTAEYEEGHIDGSVLVNPKEIIEYLDKTANASTYEKVVIACHTGQTASYYTSLLHLIGYNNVYALKFGMSGWSKKIQPNKLVNSISDKYTSKLEAKRDSTEKTYDFPQIKTGENGGYSILLARAKILASEGFGKVRISADSVMQDPSKYFIVNYWPADQYNKGHLPGALDFEPRKSLAPNELLKYLPNDKPIVVYCLSGQTSAAVVAYLRILGYHAQTLSLGANAFMHNFTQSFNNKAFNPLRDIADYELVAGKNPSSQGAPNLINTSNVTLPTNGIKSAPVKKKQKSSGGGC